MDGIKTFDIISKIARDAEKAIIKEHPKMQEVHDAVVGEIAMKKFSDGISAQMKGLIEASNKTAEEQFENMLAVVTGRIERIQQLMAKHNLSPADIGMQEGELEGLLKSFNLSLAPREGKLSFNDIYKKIHNYHRTAVTKVRAKQAEEAALKKKDALAQEIIEGAGEEKASNYGSMASDDVIKAEKRSIQKSKAWYQRNTPQEAELVKGQEESLKKATEASETYLKEIEDLKRQIASKDAEIAKNQETIVKQKEELSKIRAEIEEIENGNMPAPGNLDNTELKAAKGALNKAKEESAQLDKDKAELAALGKERDASKAKYDELKAKKQELESSIKEIEAKNAEYEQEKTELQESLKTKTTKLDSQKTELEQVKEDLNEAEAEKNFLSE